mmetsp:Transcript_117380/g.207703  ORF Transcript_117380/g.207703 Transcript_117380/m.207703 type:complete len:210 (-) Transcript_117380:11-640(-)
MRAVSGISAQRALHCWEHLPGVSAAEGPLLYHILADFLRALTRCQDASDQRPSTGPAESNVRRRPLLDIILSSTGCQVSFEPEANAKMVDTQPAASIEREADTRSLFCSSSGSSGNHAVAGGAIARFQSPRWRLGLEIGVEHQAVGNDEDMQCCQDFGKVPEGGGQNGMESTDHILRDLHLGNVRSPRRCSFAFACERHEAEEKVRAID